jgi:glucose-6-phosphate 1-dehydrogenase
MPERPSDALVLFGASGDLAAKMLYPALYVLAAKGRLEIPIIAVAKRGWDQGQLLDWARKSVAASRSVDERVFAALASRLRYLDGDLNDERTFHSVCSTLGQARRPLFYFAVPPALFAPAAEALARAGCAAGARLCVEKPFGNDLASARDLNARLLHAFDETAIFRVDHYLAADPVQNLLYFRWANPFIGEIWSRRWIRSVQITMAEDFGVETRGRFYDATGALRDVVQNHLLEVLAMAALEPPQTLTAAAIHSAGVELFEAVLPARPEQAVRGQYAGYRDIDGVAPDSTVETFVALRLAIDNERWHDVPFYIRAGKRLPLTATEVFVELQSEADVAAGKNAAASSLRFRLGPGAVEIELDGWVRKRGTGMTGEPLEFFAVQGACDDCDAYVRLLGDALAGDTTVFVPQAAVEEAWRIVDPLLRAPPAVAVYEPGSWGPAAAGRIVTERSRWHNPAPARQPHAEARAAR